MDFIESLKKKKVVIVDEKPFCLTCGCTYFKDAAGRYAHFKKHSSSCLCVRAVPQNPKIKELFSTKFNKEVLPVYKDIPVEQIVFSGKNPRKSIKLIQELADNINENGLINAISVKQLPNKKYEIVSGERRFRALLLLGWKMIPCKITQPSPYEMLAENLVRQDMALVESVPAVRDILAYKFGSNWKKILVSLGNDSNSWHEEKKEMSKVLNAIGVNPKTFCVQLPIVNLSENTIERILEHPDFYNNAIIMKLAQLKSEKLELQITESISKKELPDTQSVFRAINQASYEAKGFSRNTAEWYNFEENLWRRAQDVIYILRQLKVRVPPSGVRSDLDSKLEKLSNEVGFAIENFSKFKQKKLVSDEQEKP